MDAHRGAAPAAQLSYPGLPKHGVAPGPDGRETPRPWRTPTGSPRWARGGREAHFFSSVRAHFSVAVLGRLLSAVGSSLAW